MKIKKILQKVGSCLLIGAMMVTNITSVSMKAEARSETLRVTFTNGSLIYYDNNKGHTSWKTAHFTRGGKKYERTLYCLQPSYSTPKDSTFNATKKTDKSDLSRCFYFAQGAPGSAAFKEAMKARGYSEYVNTSNQYYAFMHIVAAYAYEQTSSSNMRSAFTVYTNGKKDGELSKRYQTAVKYAYNWCKEHVDSTDNSYEFDADGDNYSELTYSKEDDCYKSKVFTMLCDGDDKQYAIISKTSLPKGCEIYSKKNGAATFTKKKTNSNDNYLVYANEEFYLTVDKEYAEDINGITKTIKTKGGKKSIETWVFKTGATCQDMGFFTTEEGERSNLRIKLVLSDEVTNNPSISTELYDSENNNTSSPIDTNTVLIDDIVYKNFEVGQSYTIKSVLMDKSTGRPLTVNGKIIEKNTTFTPTSENGKTTITFNGFDSTNLSGKTIVAYETIYKNNEEYASHTDLNSIEQSITFEKTVPPRIRTELLEESTNKQVDLPVSSNTVLIDGIKYSNFEPGTYIAEGELIRKKDNSVIKRANVKFNTINKSGSVFVKFDGFDSKNYRGESIVAFERIYAANSSGQKTGPVIVSHENINDSKQTINFDDVAPPPELDDYGRILIKKAYKSIGKAELPESNACFQIYSSKYSSYKEASAANTVSKKVATTIYTKEDGTAITSNLYIGKTDAERQYKVKQISGKDGYKLATERTVTLKKDDIVPVTDPGKSYIINEQCPLKIKINKVDEGTGSTITSGTAKFGIYKDSSCNDLVSTVTTVNGIGTTDHLNEGIYYIKELTAPSGYDLSTSIKKVTLSYESAINQSDTYYLEYKFKNTKITYHDVIIKKTAEGGDWASALSGNASAFDKLKNEVFKFKAHFYNLEPSTKYTYSGGTFTSDSKGNATVDFDISLSKGKAEGVSNGFNVVKFNKIPSRAEYQIEELGSKYLGGNVGYTASYTVTANKQSTKVPMKSGKPGKGIISEKERFPSNKAISVTDENYPVEYTFNNSAIVRHDLVVKKRISGEEANKNDTFTYQIKLTNLKSKDSKYIVPGYTVYGNDEDGNRVVMALEERTTTTSNSYTYTINLKADQVLEMSQIDVGTEYTVTEEGSDYTPSYKKYEYLSGVNEAENSIEDKTGKPNTSLAATGTMPTRDASYVIQYDYTNTLKPDVVQATNRLNVEKFTNNGDTESIFIFKVKFENLYPSTTYAIISKGTDSYHIESSGNTLICTNASKNKRAGGVGIEITRSDGKSKHFRTDANGQLNLTDYISWIKQKGGSTINITWEGGTLRGDLTSNSIQCTQTEINKAILANCEMSSFTTSSTSNTESFSLKAGDKITFDGLNEGSKYQVTEIGNSFTPTYSIRRENVVLGTTRNAGEDKGEVKTNLSTLVRTFPIGSSYADTVSYTNEQQDYELGVDKTVVNGSTNKDFTFDVELSNLNKKNYLAVLSGNSSYDININENGDLMMLQTNGSGTDYTGMPIKIIRPDNKEMTILCNSSGVISSDQYVDWLTDGKTGTILFTVEFLNKKVQMSCTL